MDTIYLPGLEIGLMAAMLNGVAMLSQQKTLIWSVALTAAVILTLKGVASAPSMRWPALQNGLFGGLVAICLASFLTSPSMKRTVNVQGIASGVVARVDNVPVAVSLPYTLVSSIVFDAQQLVRTVISNVNPSYDQLSVDANGLVNPLKSLLNLRSLAYKTGSLESGISEIISSCLSSDSGYLAADYAKIGKLVMNSGNTGASSAQSIAIPGITTLPTNIGALLYQATLNTSDKVPGYVLASDPSLLLSCSDAVSAVASEISTALTSDDFKKWITGSVNSMDTVNPSGTPTYASLVTTYGNTRKMVVSNYTAASSAQATADVLNMAFYELVDSQLNCLRTSGEAKAACLASVNQSIEMERKNLQDAANMSTSMAYMGQFGPQVLSLLVILSPFFFMFAMFSGTGVWTKLGRVIGYVIVPLVMPGIAAEAVNAMLLYKFAAFINVLTDGGYLSHSLVHEAYKELSMNIGTASSLMASLPAVIMGLVGLSELAARTYEKATSASSATTTNATTPSLVDTASVLATRSAGDIHPNLQGGGTLIGRGVTDPKTTAMMTLAKAVTQGNKEEQVRAQNVATASNFVSGMTQLFQKGTSKQTGVGSDLHRAVRESLEAQEGSSTHTKTGDAYQSSKANNRTTTLGAGVSVEGSAKIGRSGFGFGLGGSLNISGNTKSEATDGANSTQTTSKDTSVDQANRLSQVLSSDYVKKAYQNASKEERAAFDRLYSQTRSATETLSKTDSQSKTAGTTSELRYQVSQESAGASADVIANQVKTNSDFKLAALQAEMAADQNPTLSKAITEELNAMQSGEKSGAFITDSGARKALATMRALGKVGSNPEPSPERDAAQEQLLKMFAALNHQKLTNFQAPQPTILNEKIPEANVDPLKKEVEAQLPSEKRNPKGTLRVQRSGNSPQNSDVPLGMPTINATELSANLQKVMSVVTAGEAKRIEEAKNLEDMYKEANKNAEKAGLVPRSNGEKPGTVVRAVDNAWAALQGDQRPVDLHSTQKK